MKRIALEYPDNIVKYAVLFLSFAFISAGIVRQEHLVVLKKAVKICLECIGVG